MASFWQGLQEIRVHTLNRPVVRGVLTNLLCSLAKFIFNETAAVQGTIIQLCGGIVTDGIQAITQLLQGVYSHIHVACRSVCDQDQEFDR